MAKSRRSLRSRIALGLLVYSLLLSGTVLLFGYLTNERIERVVLHSLLNAEVERFLEHRADNRRYPLPRSGTLNGYLRPSTQAAAPTVPTSLLALTPGLYNDIPLGDRSVAVFIRDVGAERIYMTVETTAIESNEHILFGWIGFWALIGALTLMLVVHWLAGRLLRPVSEFTAAVDRLEPDSRDQRVLVADDAGLEVDTIAAAINRYLERIDGFILRERRFVDSVSHELRTPIAVIGGAADIMEGRNDLSEPARKTLRRIRQTVVEVEQLIAALLVLAKEPQRLRESGEICRLDELLPALLADHVHLTQGKALQLELGPVDASAVYAPARVVQIAIANLLRNAIEHSDRGVVQVSVQPAGVVRIEDSGHGMSPEEIGQFYTATARRSEERRGRGIGLELIRRLCEHLGWTLQLQPGTTQGTLAILDMRASRIDPTS